ncbi:MAG TPA: transposase [Bryobacteraceae bacterium]|nr:transposase [Bryobacteraceae bacterium]
MTYLITFTCYGSHLHGSEDGSVDRRHAVPGTPVLERDPSRLAVEEERMVQPPYALDRARRATVLAAIQEVCAHRGWQLIAAHVRATHVHLIVEAEVSPERMMTDFKAYASRRLNRMGLDERNRRRWTRHGSTRWLRGAQSISAAVEYVVREQGQPMAVFESGER